jgi:multidrug efflux pump
VSRFNLSTWALEHRALVLYAVLVTAIAGAWSWTRLGQSEDPPFTFKAMVVSAKWPGATAEEVERQVTDRIERKLQELSHRLEFTRSYSKPGESFVFIMMRDSAPAAVVPDTWYQVRKKVGDIRHELPAGVIGPFFNDEFGDTFGNIYALTADGFSYAELKDWADRLRLELLRVPEVAKVELFGVQEERIFIEISNTRLATLGLDLRELAATLQAQNAVTTAGAFHTEDETIYLRTSGDFDSVDSIRELSVRVGDRSFRLGDIAEVRRGYVDPPRSKMRVNGVEALGIGISMAKGGDILRLGRALDAEIARLGGELPVGIEIQQVANQPRAVRNSVNEFLKVLAEAVAVVLLVSFFSLGLRSGLVVALSIPLVLAATFASMAWLDIGLHKISLGALVLALGLLVDDAIIAIEMMQVKLEQGYDRLRAASAAYEITAFPMLTGTLVTAAGFLPIATAASATGEYTRSIFQVVVIALLISWVVAVIVVPWLGFRLLPGPAAVHRGVDESAVYRTPFYLRFGALVGWCVDHAKTVIAATLIAFVLAVAGFGLVPQQFFPASTRLELLVDLRLAEGSSYTATERQVQKFEAILAEEPGIESWVAYVGTGAPRFYLSLDQQLPARNFAQFVINTKSVRDREALRERLIRLFESDFPEARTAINRLENGPPVGFPVQFRVSGNDPATLRGIAREVATVMRANPHLANVHLDWDEMSKRIRIDIDQDKLRLLGITARDVSLFLNNALEGSIVTQYREGDELIDVVLRGPAEERASLSLLKDLAIPTLTGQSVPLAQIATIDYGFEEGLIWRRDQVPTVTVRASLYGDVQPPVVTAQIERELASLRARLPLGFRIETGGTVEESAKGGASVAAGVPLFVFVVLTLLMVQLQSLPRALLVVATAPLGLIGVTLFMLVFQQPFGFVAMLGTIALSGMIMRNSVILVDQIDADLMRGIARREAIVGATVRRFRPIMLTALAAILAMIPLSRSTFFGPMAVAIMGGLFIATVLTLLFLPALYQATIRSRPAALGARQDP